MQVPYKDVGIFLNITDTSHWLKNRAGPTKMEWKLDSLVRPEHETEARWWVPDIDLSEVLINVSVLNSLVLCAASRCFVCNE